MDEKQYTVGEMAAMTGFSIRTLQYYDNIGLLPACRNAESNRRYYTPAGVIRLEQILFYKHLGFSLDEIRTHLTDSRSLSEIRELFVKQEYLLLRKIEQLHTSFAAIDASIKVIDTGNPPPLEVILQFIHWLPDNDVFEWAPSLLDTEQQAAMADLFPNLEDAQHFYHNLKGLFMDALALARAQVVPSHPQAQALAKKWQGMMQAISSENPAVLEQFRKIGANRAFGAADNPKLLEEAHEYIQKALESGASPASSEIGG